MPTGIPIRHFVLVYSRKYAPCAVCRVPCASPPFTEAPGPFRGPEETFGSPGKGDRQVEPAPCSRKAAWWVRRHPHHLYGCMLLNFGSM
jgi:hypothetical protein